MSERSLRSAATLGVPSVFSDGMVLQRHKPIRVWGTAEPGSTVTAILGEELEPVTASVDSTGEWTVVLPQQEAGRGLTLRVTDDVSVLTIHDVAIGEVWIAGGQSNMEFHLEFDADRRDVLEGPMNPDIRFFDVPKLSYPGQETEYDYSLFDHWRRCTPEDLRYVSAVGYYFAAELSAALAVPLGIVGCNWGGTPAAAWTNPSQLETGAGQVWIDEYQSGLEQFDADEEALAFRSHTINDHSDPFADPFIYRAMRDGLTRGEEQEILDSLADNAHLTIGQLHPNRPGGLFNTMVRRISKYSARGVIWYQGESDVPHADVHATVLTAVITSWREEWDDAELVFLITQLAPFGTTLLGNGTQFPLVRQQQALVAASVPYTWMASSSDAGMKHDIHPKKKRPIGERLALLARGHVYCEDILCDAPEAVGIERKNGGIAIRFRNADGLAWSGKPLPIAVQNSTGDPIDLEGTLVDGTSLVLRGEIPSAGTVQFAQTGYYKVDLRNAAGIPALPFRLTFN